MMRLLRWDGSLRKYILSLRCSVSLSNNYVTVKSCSRNINGQHQPSIQRKSLPARFRQDFLSRTSFVPWQRKVGKMHLLCDRTLFYPSSLNFCQSELYHHSMLSFALVCLAKFCEHQVLPNVMKDPVLIVRVILRRWSIKTLFLSSLRCQNSGFYVAEFRLLLTISIFLIACATFSLQIQFAI